MCELCDHNVPFDQYVALGPTDLPSVETPADEAIKERDWYALECEADDFLKKYGAAAMLRCVSRVLETRK